MPLDIGEHRWLRLLPLAVVLYLVFLPLWWYALSAITAAAGTLAGWAYHFFDPLVSIRPEGKSAIVTVTASAQSGFGGQGHSVDLRLDTITYGIPMLAALILVTHADSVRAKARSLAAGMVAMFLVTVPVLMLGAKMVSLQLYDQIGRANLEAEGNRADFFYYAFHGYAFSQPVVAVVIWIALMMLGLFKESPGRGTRAAAPSRNAPCPCGSGLKFKKCCGRA